jgi:hypothetical protein
MPNGRHQPRPQAADWMPKLDAVHVANSRWSAMSAESLSACGGGYVTFDPLARLTPPNLVLTQLGASAARYG